MFGQSKLRSSPTVNNAEVEKPKPSPTVNIAEVEKPKQSPTLVDQTTGDDDFQDVPSNNTTNLRDSATYNASNIELAANNHLNSSSWQTLGSAYERSTQEAKLAADQQEADKKEARHIIANHVVDPIEMLHLVDRWLQQVLGEFLQQRDHFRYKLKEKWDKQQLFIKSETNNKIRKLYHIVKELQQVMEDVLSRTSFEQLSDYIATVDCENVDIQDLKEKFNTIMKQYCKIMESLEYIDQELGDDNTYIKSTKESLLRLTALNQKQTHTICIVGLEKAGKSTFINGLLGFQLLPTAAERCTQIRTVLKPNLSDHLQRMATITYYNDQEFQFYFDRMMKKTDDDDDKFQARKHDVMQTHESLRKKPLTQHFDITARDENSREVERQQIIEQLHEYIKGEVYVNIIKEIVIYTDRLPGKNYELLDVPGFDSPIKEHRDAGLNAVAMADAFLFLTNGQSPSLTEPQVRLLQEIQSYHYEAMQRAFGIITKLDLCQTSTIFRDHYEKAKGELIDKHFDEAHIFAACPRLELLDGSSEEFKVIDEKIRHFGDLRQGFNKTKQALDSFIQYELPKAHLKQLVDLGKTRLFRFVCDYLDRVKQSELLPDNLAVMSIDEYISTQNTENWDQYYYNERFNPTFRKGNSWHAAELTEKRSEFLESAKNTFRDCFLQLTEEFMKTQYNIQKIINETYDFTKLVLNPHPPDNEQRGKLSFQLENIVDKASDKLSEYFYHNYVRQLEEILNEISPEQKDLYRTKLTYEKCKCEVHALILRVSRPVILATLRYSHSDSVCKDEAIRELICVAPIVAHNIVFAERSDNSGNLTMGIPKLAKLLVGGKNVMLAKVIMALFKL